MSAGPRYYPLVALLLLKWIICQLICLEQSTFLRYLFYFILLFYFLYRLLSTFAMFTAINCKFFCTNFWLLQTSIKITIFYFYGTKKMSAGPGHYPLVALLLLKWIICQLICLEQSTFLRYLFYFRYLLFLDIYFILLFYFLYHLLSTFTKFMAINR